MLAAIVLSKLADSVASPLSHRHHMSTMSKQPSPEADYYMPFSSPAYRVTDEDEECRNSPAAVDEGLAVAWKPKDWPAPHGEGPGVLEVPG